MPDASSLKMSTAEYVGAVEAESAEHWSFAHIYVSVDGEVGNVSVLVEGEVFELDLAVGAVYVECQIFTACGYN